MPHGRPRLLSSDQRIVSEGSPAIRTIFARGRSHAGFVRFTLEPTDPDGQTLFTARHDVRLTTVDSGTDVELTRSPVDVRAGADAALGGLGIGWERLLDNLAALARHNGLHDAGRLT